MKAVWKDTIIAQSENTIEVEGNQYFPLTDVRMEFLEQSPSTSVCPWKGEACYYTISVDGERNHDAAWQYKEPKEAAKEIKEHIAFWKGVEVKR